MDARAVVGLNVLRLRRERELSQEELSFRSGATRAYLSGLEAGRRNPTLLSLARLAAALEVGIEELVREPVRLPADGPPQQQKADGRKRKAARGR